MEYKTNADVHDPSQTNESNQNLLNICCPRCSSIILKHNSAKLTSRQCDLPVFSPKSDLSNPSKNFPTESVNNFWCVNDMYTFENVGFTNSVDTMRYLTCADCDLGPLGFHDNNEGPPKAYYIAICRTIDKPVTSNDDKNHDSQ